MGALLSVLSRLVCLFFLLLLSSSATASSSEIIDLTTSWVGYLSLVIFVTAYVFVILEEKTHLRKSKPVMVSAGLIWAIIAIQYSLTSTTDTHAIEHSINHNFIEFAQLFFFLLVAMTYINAMLERGVFDALRDWLIDRGFSYKALFWITGALAFVISPLADNLTTALIMCAVVLTVGQENQKFIALGCVNIVVAANAGGAFSPFGDITTLMVWQKGILDFFTFLKLILPSLVNFLIPALILQMFIQGGTPKPRILEHTPHASPLKSGGLPIVGLFLLTIVTAVSFHHFLHIPPVFGMMLGLGYLKLYGFFLRRAGIANVDPAVTPGSKDQGNFDVFDRIAHAEWDTLFFFYGVILSVGGLGFIGYLSFASEFMYGELGPTTANILVGILSAIIDNIPVMFAVLTMNPTMDETQWLLVTLTAGVGGSLLSIGSAAGVALMGQARGQYTFFSHLKWTPAIALGYAASIYVHFLVNG